MRMKTGKRPAFWIVKEESMSDFTLLGLAIKYAVREIIEILKDDILAKIVMEMESN